MAPSFAVIMVDGPPSCSRRDAAKSCFVVHAGCVGGVIRKLLAAAMHIREPPGTSSHGTMLGAGCYIAMYPRNNAVICR